MQKRIARIATLAALLGAMSCAIQPKPPTAATVQAWLQKYGAAWEARDAQAAGPLFTADATYHEMPFDPVKQGRSAIEDYWKTVTADQRDIQFESRVIAVNGDTAVAHWSATFKLRSNGASIALDGVFVLEFDASGQCRSLREWWHVKS